MTKLLVMQSYPVPNDILPLRSKYSPQHTVLKYPISRCKKEQGTCSQDAWRL